MAREQLLPHGAPDVVRDLERADIEIAEQAASWRDNRVVRALGSLSELADQPP